MTKKTRRLKYKSKLEQQQIGRAAGLRGAAMQRAKFDRFALARMKRARAESNALAERMARDAD
jgi:hypothetical protein